MSESPAPVPDAEHLTTSALRVAKILNAILTRHVHECWLNHARYDIDGQINTVFHNGAFERMYVYLNGEQLAEYFNNTVYFPLTDNLGSTRLVTGLDQSVQENNDYYPYGELILGTGGTVDVLKFTGKERDAETGLDYFGARYNASNMGRFMTPDPLMASAHVSNPQTWNRYAYALNNPLRITDPEGLYPSPAYNCDKDHTACLNDEQRRILENSTGKDKDGNKISGEALYQSLNEKQQNAFVNITDKLASITLSDGTSAISQVSSVTTFKEDRILSVVSATLSDTLVVLPVFPRRVRAIMLPTML